jgi:hypothetical protein
MADYPDILDDPSRLLELFLTGYWSKRTRANYAFILNGWFDWCRRTGRHGPQDADSRLLERWITDMKQRPDAANTIAARVVSRPCRRSTRARAAARPQPRRDDPRSRPPPA